MIPTKAQSKKLIKSLINLLMADTCYELEQFSIAVDDDGLGLRIRGGKGDTTFYTTSVIALLEPLPVNQYLKVVDGQIELKVYVVA